MKDAYTTALTWLARRELSTRQLRERLVRRGFDEAAVDAAVQRLTADGTLDDRRVARAAARTAAAVKGHGRRRVLQQLQQLGVDEEAARAAVDDTFTDIDEIALLDRAIEKRLRGQSAAALDTNARARLVRALVRQGFSAGHVLARLRERGSEGDE